MNRKGMIVLQGFSIRLEKPFLQDIQTNRLFAQYHLTQNIYPDHRHTRNGEIDQVGGPVAYSNPDRYIRSPAH